MKLYFQGVYRKSTASPAVEGSRSENYSVLLLGDLLRIAGEGDGAGGRDCSV